MPKKNNWTQKEDKLLIKAIKVHGKQQWALIANQMHEKHGLQKRSGKQYRERWINHLDPTVNKSQWTQEQEIEMFKLHKQHGNKWRAIAERLSGRSENSVKNHFYSTVRRSLRRISKHLGQKNSSSIIKQIKPATLSKVFDVISGINDKEIEQQLKDEDQKKPIHIYSCQQEQELQEYIRNHCMNLTLDILRFSSFDHKNQDQQMIPIIENRVDQVQNNKTNQKNLGQNIQFDQNYQILDQKCDELNERLTAIVNRMHTINELYQKFKIKKEPKRKRKTKVINKSIQSQKSIKQSLEKLQKQEKSLFVQKNQTFSNQQILNNDNSLYQQQTKGKTFNKKTKVIKHAKKQKKTKNLPIQFNFDDKINKNYQISKTLEPKKTLFVDIAQKRNENQQELKLIKNQYNNNGKEVKQKDDIKVLQFNQIQSEMNNQQNDSDEQSNERSILMRMGCQQIQSCQLQIQKGCHFNIHSNKTPIVKSSPFAISPQKQSYIIWNSEDIELDLTDGRSSAQLNIELQQLNGLLAEVRNQIIQKTEGIK